jgi:dihydrodipicolinate synthase/N-acetylneuraminate lyase
MSDLGGINLAMQTPMHADGSIDYARWEEAPGVSTAAAT